MGRDGLSNSTLFASLGASLLYLHNLIFPGTFPLISGLTWLLEVEVQYYILAPFILGDLDD